MNPTRKKKLYQSYLEDFLSINYEYTSFSFVELGIALAEEGYHNRCAYRFKEKLLQEGKIEKCRTVPSGSNVPPTSYYSITDKCGVAKEKKYEGYRENLAGILAQMVILGMGEKNVDRNHELG